MNFSGMMWLGTWLAFGIIGYSIGAEYGAWPSALGAIVGLVSFLGLILSIHLSAWSWERWQPLRPPCRCGKCKKTDEYELVRHLDNDGVFQCFCGSEYVQRGRRFMEVLADGSIQPYMQRSRFGKWRVDKGA